ncbi:MAG TPA: class I SAM-dependent methyltransferase [Streptosporangiaceae bacterium]|jgi:SAM-dependent methyltransferase
MIYQHPLAYLLGLEGVSLLHAFAGDYDREFTQARLAEIRALLDSAGQMGGGAAIRPIPIAEGYRAWAGDYDQPGNQLIDLEQPIVREILDGLPRGTALDAACGTGRHAAYLAALGHTVIGVDISPEMLALARVKVPGAVFCEGDLHQLPVPGQHADVVVCALALTHVPELAPVLTEFVRVLRPGGHLVISDSRGLLGYFGSPVVKALPGGEFGYLPHRNRLTSDYLAAALPLGLQVRRCEEPRRPHLLIDPATTPDTLPAGEPPDIWSLHSWCPAATNAAYRDNPAAIIWHFQLLANC